MGVASKWPFLGNDVVNLPFKKLPFKCTYDFEITSLAIGPTL
jgi:hypothetical protein